VRPLLDRACVGCHSGARRRASQPRRGVLADRELPGGTLGDDPHASPPWLSGVVPPAELSPHTTTRSRWAWFFQREDAPYRVSADWSPLDLELRTAGRISHRGPGYQTSFAPNGTDRLRLSRRLRNSNFGRSDRQGGNSSDAWLVEILTGRDVDPSLTFTGPDHTSFLTELEVRELMGVMTSVSPSWRTATTAPSPRPPRRRALGRLAITQFDDATR